MSPRPQHPQVRALRDESSARYSFRNWSYAFKCPSCQQTKRYNVNFLGRRRVECTGEKFVLVRPEGA